MKKALLFFILAVGVNSFMPLFSDEPPRSDAWISLGYEYGLFFDKYLDGKKAVESFTGSPGISIEGYRFFNGNNFGIFVHGFLASPAIYLVYTDDVGVRTDSDDFVANMQTGLLVGPAFRFTLDRASFKFGIGFCSLSTSLWYTEYTTDKGDGSYQKGRWSFGIGGDIGIKFNITDAVFLNTGSIFTFDFLGSISVETPYEKYSGWAKDYIMAGIRPYIAIGMNL